MGKCISFSLAFNGAKFYIKEMAASIARASKGTKVSLTSALREEIQVWRFMDDWDSFIPWRHERHVALFLSPDASFYRWGLLSISSLLTFPSATTGMMR